MEQEFPPLLVYPEGWTSLGLLIAAGLLLLFQPRWFPRRADVLLLAFWTLATVGLFVRWGWFLPPRPFSQSWTYLVHLHLLLVPLLGLALTFFRDFLGTRPELRKRLKPRLESLLAIGVLSFILFGLLLPAFQPERPRIRSTCRNKLKQIGLAMLNYHDTVERLPATAGGQPPVSWRVLLLPYLDQAPMFNAYDQAKRWNESPNAEFLLRDVWVYRCPGVQRPADEQGRFFTSYVAPVGPRTMLRSGEGRQLRDITDGSSNTIAVVEACGLEILWTEPRDFDVTQGPVGINLKGHGRTDSPGVMSGYHTGGVHALFGDGAVRFLSQKTDPAVLNALLTADGGDDSGESW